MPDEITPTSQVSEQDKTAFFKSFLSDTPFESEDSLFDGKIKIKFKSLTVEEASDVFDQLRLDQDLGAIINDSSYVMALTRYRLALSIASINGEPFVPEATKEAYTTDSFKASHYVKVKATSLEKWSVFKLSAFAEAFKNFEDKVVLLTKAITDPSFWPADK